MTHKANDDDDDSLPWAEFHFARQQKRADNRESSADLLTKKGITFQSKNLGAHLIVEGGDVKGVVDFWPGTGKWIARKGSTGRGVFNLIKYLGKEK